MIKALVFDCFGVLYWDNINQFYSLVAPSDFNELRDLVGAFDHGYITKADFYKRAGDLAKIDSAAAEVVMISRQRNEELIERVPALKEHYKIGLLSNMGSGTISDVFSAEETKRLFDEIILSSDVGLTKPSEGIFEVTLARLGMQPEEVIFIDDRPMNTDAAEHLGIKTILFTNNHQFEAELARILEATNA